MGKVPEKHVQPEISRLPFLEDATVPPLCIMALSFLHHNGDPRLLRHEPIVVGAGVFSGASRYAGRRGTELAGLVLPVSGLPYPSSFPETPRPALRPSLLPFSQLYWVPMTGKSVDWALGKRKQTATTKNVTVLSLHRPLLVSASPHSPTTTFLPSIQSSLFCVLTFSPGLPCWLSW